MNDDRSWGFHWQWTPYSRDPEAVHIYLQTPEKIAERFGPKFYGLSVCDTSKRPYKIFFDSTNWLRAPKASGYKSTKAYRTYVINHEFGHILGHGHSRCVKKGSPASVMLQQTIGLRGCTANPWPYYKK